MGFEFKLDQVHQVPVIQFTDGSIKYAHAVIDPNTGDTTLIYKNTPPAVEKTKKATAKKSAAKK